MEGFRRIPNYTDRKLDADFNLDYVEVRLFYRLNFHLVSSALTLV